MLIINLVTGETNKIVEKKVETVKPESSREVRLRESSNKKKANSSSCSAQGYTALLDFIDLVGIDGLIIANNPQQQSLGQVFVELDFLDSSAGQDFFAVGISGDVFLRVPHQAILKKRAIQNSAFSGQLCEWGSARSVGWRCPLGTADQQKWGQCR